MSEMLNALTLPLCLGTRSDVAWARFSTCRRWCSVSRRRASATARSSSVNRRRDSYWVCTR